MFSGSIAGMNLSELAQAARGGFALGQGTMQELRSAAGQLGWTEVPVRRGDPPVSELRPSTREQSAPRSLSALFGLAAQPLHTDGAHIPRPPDVVALVAEQMSSTPTLVWAERGTSGRHLPGAARHGVFLVDSGRNAFYATAVREGHGLAYDPGCMTPCDQRARQLVDYFAAQIGEADQVNWTEPNQVLIIDNRRALHARAAVPPDDLNRRLNRVAFQVPS